MGTRLNKENEDNADKLRKLIQVVDDITIVVKQNQGNSEFS